MIAEIHWWIKDIAEGARQKFKGVDIIDKSTILNFSQIVDNDRFADEMDINDISIPDVITVMDTIGDVAQDESEDGACMLQFSLVCSTSVIMPEDWGVKCIKFKKTKTQKELSELIKKFKRNQQMFKSINGEKLHTRATNGSSCNE